MSFRSIRRGARKLMAATLTTGALLLTGSTLAPSSPLGAPAATAATSAPIWSGDFETNNLAQWPTVLGAAPDRITPVQSPRRQGQYAAKFTAYDGDLQGGANPRAQLNSPVLHYEGSDHFIAWSTLFPNDFPAIVSRDGVNPWFVFFQWHGEPYNGSPLPGVFNVTTDAADRSTIGFARSAQYGYDRPWSAPLVKNVWHDFVVHVKFSKNPGVGFVELWYDGVQQRWANGSYRQYQSTIMPDQNAGLYTIATNYRARGMVPGPVTIYHDAVRVGNTYESVAPSGSATSAPPSQQPSVPNPVDSKCLFNGYKAQYFNNTDLSGSPALTRCEGSIANDWGWSSPAPGVNPDNFSVRWTKTLNVASAGSYVFSTSSDDGVRVYLDGNLIIDNWHDHGVSTSSATRTLSAGTHHLKVEYYDHLRSAVAKFDITRG